jgi:hypothetical protein
LAISEGSVNCLCGRKCFSFIVFRISSQLRKKYKTYLIYKCGPVPVGQISTNGSFKCKECDTSFNSQQELEQHEKYATYRRKGCCWQ